MTESLTTPPLSFHGVTRRWRAGLLGTCEAVTALDRVSFVIGPGEIVAVTGGAGAGKSTLLMLATGMVAPTEGVVRWAGSPLVGAVRPQLIGARPWEYHFLTVREALAFQADILALREDVPPPPTRFVPLMAEVGLRGESRTRLGQLSALDAFRVVVAQALLAAPQLVCCEEPFAFCGPAEKLEATRLLQRLAGRGIAFLLATRDASGLVALGLPDRTLRLARGRLEAEDRASRSVLELSVPSPADAFARLSSRLPSLARRGRRLRVPLRGHSPESILALCRDVGVRVRASRVAEERGALPAREDAP